MQIQKNFVKQYSNYVHNIDVSNNIVLTVDEVECAMNSLKMKNLQGRITQQLNICSLQVVVRFICLRNSLMDV